MPAHVEVERSSNAVMARICRGKGTRLPRMARIPETAVIPRLPSLIPQKWI